MTSISWSRDSDDLSAAGKAICWLMILIISFPLALYHAWVVSMLWDWFITNTFGILPPTLWVIAGLTLLVRFILPLPYSPERKVIELLVHLVVVGVLIPSLALGEGWVFAKLAGL